MNAALTAVLFISIVLQLLAAVFALRLIRRTSGTGGAWLLLSLAILLMVARRLITSMSPRFPAVEEFLRGPLAETIALTIAVLVLLGVLRIPRVFDALTTARVAAEEARRRAVLQAEASELLLAGSPVMGARLDALSRLLVPSLGDLCAIDARRPGAPVRVAHGSGALAERVARELRAIPGASSNAALESVLQTGRPLLVPEADPTRLAEIVPAEGAREAASASLLVVPMAARGETFGTLTLVSFSPTRRYGEVERELLQDLARRAAVALDNARLHEQAQAAEEQLRQSLSLLRATLESTADGLLVVDRSSRIVVSNQLFRRMWGIPDDVMARGEDEAAIASVLGGVKDPEAFISRVRALYAAPEATSFDVVELRDGRVFERLSQPQVIGERIVGRVWSFRDATERRRAEEALRRSESRFRRLFESNLVGVVFVTLEGAIVDANDYFLRLVGRTREEVSAGLRWTELTPPEWQPADERALREMKARGVSSLFEKEYVHRDGHRVPVLLGASLLEGSQTDAVAFVLDLTRRKRVEASRDRLLQQSRFLAETSALLSQSLDFRTTIDQVARLALPWLGDFCTVDLLEDDGRAHRVAAAHVDPALEPLVRELASMFAPGLDARVPAARVIRTGQNVLIEDLDDAQRRTIGGGTRAEELVRQLGSRSVLCIPLLRRGRVIGAMTFHACRPRHFGPEEITLAEELGLRCATAIENTQLYAEAQRSIQLRDEFIALASHELRTPLTPLRLQLGLLGRLLRSGELPPPAFRERIGTALHLCDLQLVRLTRLAEALLDTSLVSAGRLTLERAELDLAELVRRVVATFAPEAAGAGCAVSVDAPSPVHGRWDRQRCEEVVSNLMSNALKFGRGAPVEVRVRSEHGRGTIRVRDHGPGVPPEDRQRIFERFARATSIRTHEGLGLGLYLTREIVRLHGGEIRIEGAAGEGSTFVVELPLAAPGTASTSAARAGP